MIAAPLVLAVLVSAFAPPRTEMKGPLPPALEAQAKAVGKTIRCAVCQGLSVADSPSPMAQAMMDRVRELVEEGKSDAEVRAYFVERYGEWILLEPTTSGFNLLVWLLPFVFVGLGLAVIASKRRTQAAQAPAASQAVAQSPADDYLSRVRRDVE